jgi:hypothetical protein
VIYLETADAGAFLRFTDTYAGGRASSRWRWIRRRSTPARKRADQRPRFLKGEASLDRAWLPAVGRRQRRFFSRVRAEFTRQNGQLTIRRGRPERPDDRRHHRRQHRFPRQPGA